MAISLSYTTTGFATFCIAVRRRTLTKVPSSFSLSSVHTVAPAPSVASAAVICVEPSPSFSRMCVSSVTCLLPRQ
jgi:hypothetical protein